ncbi:helix-turn-helix transcriptional regulator [Alkalicaulis satelles]|uniref:Helix-turn-helix transcriptional regulator n=1 Tax=Alkalicaulis satelles TaxID=2609175 RepID=A0A5M6ZFQ1_9PROT|nr:helix-turn-helix domain-containing protein [Alkalicaulis satelles]KAA5803576.1 helix-turn-helix transcriptional regulator [Alkalicaulis satelles]
MPSLTDLAVRVEALEVVIEKLQGSQNGDSLQILRSEAPEGGAVRFEGSIDLPDNSRIDWVMSHPASGLLAADWAEIAPTLAALGHPVRLHLLQHVLNGTRETSALVQTLGEGTTGQLHHHLRELTSTGWLSSERRGRYSVPADRIVPLLIAVAAAGGPDTGQDGA